MKYRQVDDVVFARKSGYGDLKCKISKRYLCGRKVHYGLGRKQCTQD